MTVCDTVTNVLAWVWGHDRWHSILNNVIYGKTCLNGTVDDVGRTPQHEHHIWKRSRCQPRSQLLVSCPIWCNGSYLIADTPEQFLVHVACLWTEQTRV